MFQNALKQLLRRRASVAMLVIGFTNIGIGFITTVLLANILPAAEYGSYIFAFGIANIIALPIEMGLPTLMMREIARYRASENHRAIIAIAVWVLALVLGTFALTLAAAMIYWGLGIPSEKIGFSLQIWTLALLLPLALMNWARGILLGFEKPVQFALPDSIFRPALLLTFVAMLAYSGNVSAPYVMAAHVLAVALCFVWSAVGAFRIVRRQIGSFEFSRADMDISPWIKSLIPISLVKGVRIINRRIDIAMIGFLSTTIAVAGYNIAVQIVSLILVAQTVLNSVIAPRIAFAHERGDTAEMQRSIALATLASTGFAIATVVGIVIFGPWLIGRMFGGQYGDVYPVILVLCIGQLFSAFMGPTALLLNMSRFEKRTLQTGVVAAVINVSINFALIPSMLAMGAAIASSVTLVVIQMQRWWMVRRLIGVRSDIFSAVVHIRTPVQAMPPVTSRRDPMRPDDGAVDPVKPID